MDWNWGERKKRDINIGQCDLPYKNGDRLTKRENWVGGKIGEVK